MDNYVLQQLQDLYEYSQPGGSHEFSGLSQNLKFNETAFCDGSDYTKFRVMEFGVKSIPAVLFFICGTYRLLSIKDIGVGNTTFTTFFKAKLGISACMAIADLIYIMIVLIMPARVEHSSWINQCGQDGYTVVYAFQGAAWGYSCYLMIFEYRRRRSEEWYANQLYWCLNLIFEIVTVMILITDYLHAPMMLITAIINVLGNLLLVVLMFKTEKRTADNPRPEVSSSISTLLLSSEMHRRRRGQPVVPSSGPYITVRFQETFMQGKDGVNLFQFRVMIHESELIIKLQKRYSEFQRLEQVVLGQVEKQSMLFYEAGREPNDIQINQSYHLSNLSPIPKLDYSSNLVSGDRTNSTSTAAQDYERRASSVYQGNGLIAFTKNLERFCTEVVDNKLLWTPEILLFFGITDERLLREFEIARENHMRTQMNRIEGKKSTVLGMERKMSYVNLDTLDDEHPIEEEYRDQSRSLDFKKHHSFNKVAPAQPSDETITRTITSLPPSASLGPSHSLALSEAYPIGSMQQSMATEDSENKFYNQLRDGAYPVNVKFIKWQDSNLGKFIEFNVKVLYTEGINDSFKPNQDSPKGQRISKNVQGNKEWDIFKRYSSFIDLHEKLGPYFLAEKLNKPVLPPQIQNKNNAQRNMALTQRKNQLQAYLRQILLAMSDRMPGPLLEFLNFQEQGSQGFSAEILQQISQVNLRSSPIAQIVSTKLLYIDFKPKNFYKLELQYKPHPTLPGEPQSGDKKLTTYKQYSDFLFLDQIVRLSLQDSNDFSLMDLPPKKHEHGTKKLAEELQTELNQYMKELLEIPAVCRMLQTKLFFVTNQVSEEDEQEAEQEILESEGSLLTRVEVKKANKDLFENNEQNIQFESQQTTVPNVGSPEALEDRLASEEESDDDPFQLKQ